MNRRRLVGFLLIGALVASCTSASSSDDNISTGFTPLDNSVSFATRLDDVFENAASFVCHRGGSLNAWREDFQFMRYALSDKPDDGALEELTVDGITYARHTAPEIPADFMPEKKEMWERAGSGWVTANQPDTIGLEGAVSSPAACLAQFVAIDSVDSVVPEDSSDGTHYKDGISGKRFVFEAATDSPDSIRLLLLGSDDSPDEIVMAWNHFPADFNLPAGSTPADVIEVSFDEFQAFVG